MIGWISRCLATGAARGLRQWLRRRLWTHPADHRHPGHQRHLYRPRAVFAADARRQGRRGPGLGDEQRSGRDGGDFHFARPAPPNGSADRLDPVPLLLGLLVVLFVWLPFARSVTAAASTRSVLPNSAYMSGVALNRGKLAAFTMAGFFAAVGGCSSPCRPRRQRRHSPGRRLYPQFDRRGRHRGHLADGRSGGAVGSNRRPRDPHDLLRVPDLRRGTPAPAALRGDGAARRRSASARPAPPAHEPAGRSLDEDAPRCRLVPPRTARSSSPAASSSSSWRSAPSTRSATQGNATSSRRLTSSSSSRSAPPRDRRGRDDARDPARPYRPFGALDAGRRGHDGDRRRRHRWAFRSASPSGSRWASSTASASPICACPR